MNASALLKSQGWRGKGHSLHPTDNSIGLANPLLLSRNTDGRGIGANKTFTDQWWLAAFDEKLKGLDVSKKGVVVQSVKEGQLNAVGNPKGARYAGLYASFVWGGLMEGTLSPEGEESTDGTSGGSEDLEGMGKRKESKAERRARREARKTAREERRAAKAEKKKKKRAELKAAGGPGRQQETKEERRARRAERTARKEARRKRREEKAARKAANG